MVRQESDLMKNKILMIHKKCTTEVSNVLILILVVVGFCSSGGLQPRSSEYMHLDHFTLFAASFGPDQEFSQARALKCLNGDNMAIQLFVINATRERHPSLFCRGILISSETKLLI